MISTSLLLAITFSSVALLLILALSYPWPWIRKATCVNCQKSRTRNRSDEGLPICDDCEETLHTKKLIEEKTKDEKILKCPVDDTPMQKVVFSEIGVVIDKCPECEGSWFSKEEKQQIKDVLGQQSEASSNNFATGLVIGMVIN
jgi:hypothetical protein